jgi:hypothetical protein
VYPVGGVADAGAAFARAKITKALAAVVVTALNDAVELPPLVPVPASTTPDVTLAGYSKIVTARLDDPELAVNVNELGTLAPSVITKKVPVKHLLGFNRGPTRRRG